MSPEKLVTICITMGLRPDVLQQTLESLSPELRKLPMVGINDFGDVETSEVFDRLCPHAERIDLGKQVGHHAAVDAMYAKVRTPYVFHMEDDWEFTRHDFLNDAIRLLEQNAKISSVCFRDTDNFFIEDKARALIVEEETDGIRYARMDALSPKWYGYTFNPHLARISLWEDFGGFSGFKRESHISRKLRADGKFTAFLKPGACQHIGFVSVAHKPPSRFKRFKNWLRGRPTPNA